MLRQLALDVIAIADPQAKSHAALAIDATCAVDTQAVLTACQTVPGRLDQPALVAPNDLVKRSMRTVHGRAALIHGLAHIELNAINLALDAVWRFAAMPDAYYRDWLQVAKEEATHFGLLSKHLNELGYQYGDFPAHNRLWEMAQRTQDDVLARMALVPRTLEARGLDASIPIRDKLLQAGDVKAADILNIILRDEIGHVAVGNRWYAWLCAQRGLDPVTQYPLLAQRYRAPILRPPFNTQARLQAGFTTAEIEQLVIASAQRYISSG